MESIIFTITEHGYTVDDADVTAVSYGDFGSVSSAIGLGVAGLLQRYNDQKLRDLPFTVLSCDNVQQNGEIARAAFEQFGKRVGGGFLDWMRQRVSFPTAMVDKITPRLTDEHKMELHERFGVTDAAPVVCEPAPALMWVLQVRQPNE